MSFQKLLGSKGCFSEKNGIIINENMSGVQTLKTLLHEYIHSKYHGIINNNVISQESGKYIERSVAEIEAEATAYILLQHYGVDSSDYSFEYLAGWSKNKTSEELENCLKNIVERSNDTIKDLDLFVPRVNCAINKCSNPVMMQTYIEQSEYLSSLRQQAIAADTSEIGSIKQLYNAAYANVDKASMENVFVEICWSESPNFKEGEIYTISKLDSKFTKIDQETKRKYIEANVPNTYDKVMFKVYINGENTCHTLRERYDFGDCKHKTFTELMQKTPERDSFNKAVEQYRKESERYKKHRR